jgi:S-adenosylmethionine:diacylglycerol 3-amino-3-carboxypropyl transferase
MMESNKNAAKRGGAVAGIARERLKKTGKKVVSKDNYLLKSNKKRID